MSKKQDKNINISYFLLPYLLFFIFTAFILIIFSKAEIHLWFNQYHSKFFDTFFKYITNMGNGLFILIVAAFLLFYRIRYSVGVLTTFLLSGLFSQIVKHITNMPRPVKYFEGTHSLYLVDGVKTLMNYSFPSGHSASAFALCFSLAVIIKNKYGQLLMFILALTIAYSRVYLSQHFLMDIWIGSAIGIIIAFLYWNFEKKLQYPWMDQSIIKITNNKTSQHN
jgi:membrane-associated phospholipid phosphatase